MGQGHSRQFGEKHVGLSMHRGVSCETCRHAATKQTWKTEFKTYMTHLTALGSKFDTHQSLNRKSIKTVSLRLIISGIAHFRV